MRGLLLFLVLLAGLGCTRKSAPPETGAGSPDRPSSAVESTPSPAPIAPVVVDCDPKSVSSEFAEAKKSVEGRRTVEEAAKSKPSAANFQRWLDFEQTVATRAERALQSVATCTTIAPSELKSIREIESRARENITYLRESLSGASAR